MMNYRILLIDEDLTVGRLLRYSLTRQGNTVEWCQNIKEAPQAALSISFEIVIFNVVGPLHNGLEILAQLSNLGDFPVILLSDWSQEEEVVRALSMGAEDVIFKPFGYSELMARINAIMRRVMENELYPLSTVQEDEVFRFGVIEVYPKRWEITYLDHRIAFRKDEFSLLFHLLKEPGTVFSARQLQEVVFGTYVYKTNRIIFLVSAIRKKLQAAVPFIEIQTIPSVGYKLTLK